MNASTATIHNVSGRFDSFSETAAVIDAICWAAAEPNISGIVVQDTIRISKGLPGSPGVFIVPMFITALRSDLLKLRPNQAIQLELGGAA